MTKYKRMITAGLYIAFLITGGLTAKSVQAEDDTFFVELATDHVDITTDFTGEEIRLFGYRRDKEANVAIVIRGPDKNITVWKKAQILGAWVNRYSTTYKNIPLYYDYALGKPEHETAPPEVLSANEIGVAEIFAAKSSKTRKDFEEALISKKQKANLFPETYKHIRFLNDNFFRVSFPIPPTAPTGQYTVESYLIKDGKVQEKDFESVKIEQVGLNAFLYRASQDHAMLYGIFCIIFAVFSGWLVSALKVKP